jgi:excisionase family DNA binding protein
VRLSGNRRARNGAKGTYSVSQSDVPDTQPRTVRSVNSPIADIDQGVKGDKDKSDTHRFRPCIGSQSGAGMAPDRIRRSAMKNKLSYEIPVLLSVAETAERCGVSTKTVRRWIKHRGLRIYRPGEGRLIRISESDITKFLNNGRRN